MSTKILFLLLMIGFSSLLTESLGWASSYQAIYSPTNDQGGMVGFCELIKKPAQYSGRTIRLRAVLVENNSKALIDGADPFLYDPGCRDEKLKVVVRWSFSSRDSSRANGPLQSIRARSDEFSVSRATVLLVGTLSGPRKERFGHLGWADLEFDIQQVEEAEPVAASLPWPTRVEDAYRRARAIP